jgi:hypothetical protein
MEKESSNFRFEEKEVYYLPNEDYLIDYHLFKNSYPILLRNATLIIAYAEPEDVIKFICTVLANKK